IYIPVYMDFRGRIYPLLNYLTYQGVDLARSLILFDDNEEINDDGISYLYQYFANVYGFNKKSI
ncbi:hypothetical protein BJ085DRAFT_12867, partial [Dimargaris cristalligena]